DLIQPRTLQGFRDYPPELMIPREHMLEHARRVYRAYGYAPIDTPALELTEILLGKGGAETDKQLYRFTDNDRRHVALRFHLAGAFRPFARRVDRHAGHDVQPLSHGPGVARRAAPAWSLPRVLAVRFRPHRHPQQRQRHRSRPGHQ